jgi:hypothetical protein
MIKLTGLRYMGTQQYELEFSDGSIGLFDLLEYRKQRHGPLLTSLDDGSLAARAFIDAGAMCWPHGLELSAQRLHEIATFKVAV